MRIIKLLTLGFLAGYVYSASPTTHFERTERYGQVGIPGGLDSGQYGRTRFGHKLKGPLAIAPTSMVKVGSCDVDGCMIYFTDSHANTIRLLHKPTDAMGTITTIAGQYGRPGDVDGPVIEIPDGEHGHHHGHHRRHKHHHGHHDGSDSPRDGLRYDSDEEHGHEPHKHGKGHKESHDVDDGYNSEDEALRKQHPEAYRLVEEFLKGREKGAVDTKLGHEYDSEERKSMSRRGSMDSISDGVVDCSDDGPLDGLESIFGDGKGPALLNKPHCIAALDKSDPSTKSMGDSTTKYIIFGEQACGSNGGALRCLKIKDYSKPGEIATITRDVNPVALTSNRTDKIYCADEKSIFEMDFSYHPPVKRIIAGEDEVDCDEEYEERGEDFDLTSALQKLMKTPCEDLLAKYQRESTGDSDSEPEEDDDFGGMMGGSNSGGKVKTTVVTPVNGISSLTYRGDDHAKALYYTTTNNPNGVEQLSNDGSGWVHGAMQTEDESGNPVSFNNPTYVNANQEDGAFLILDADGLKKAELSKEKAGTYVVKLIIPADADNIGDDKDKLTSGAAVAVQCCNGIEVGGGHVIETFQPVAQPGTPPSGSTAGTLAEAGAANIKLASEGQPIDEQEFRFGLSPQQIMLSMRQKGVNFSETNTPYSRALNAVEKAVDSSHAIKQIGRGMTVWVSGLYTQARLSSMFGNPSMKDKHYAIMAGTHYKDIATQQIFGVAVNVGFGNSVSETDRDLRKDSKAAQVTLYYNKKFDQEGHWKFSWHNSLMRSMDRKQRPFDDRGSKQIAIGNAVVYEFASSAELSYKHEFCKDNYIKPFTALNYIFNKDMAYQEKNVGINNLSYSSASMTQIGLQFGIKSSFGKKISDTKTLVFMPKISYTNFAKMGIASQTSTNIASGAQSTGKSGTPGRHLISATLAFGMVDYEANMTTRVAYTGSIQQHKRSHEIMLDWGMKF